MREDCIIRLYSAFSKDIYSYVPLGDFCEIPVHCTGLQNSNQFLLSLWNEMNKVLHPIESEFVPWFYRPNIEVTDKNGKILMLGDVHTSQGNFHLMLNMKDKSSIRSILVYHPRLPKDKYKQLFESIISEAKKNINSHRRFGCKVRLKCEGAVISNGELYSGHFFIFGSDVKGFYVEFWLLAIDIIEAQRQSMIRIDKLCSFLAVETNLFFSILEPFEIKEIDKALQMAQASRFNNPFIDGTSIRDGVLLLSEAGINYLDRYVFVERDMPEEDEEEIALYFRRSCAHVYEGLAKQLEKGDKWGYSTNTQNMFFSNNGIPRQQNIITMAAMNYLSAIETASMPEGQPATCPECGNVIYKISARVEKFASQYLSSEAGRIFKELYNMRSKYLHAGKLSCESYQITARPFVDPSTGSGLSDYGFISCKISGKLAIIAIQNIQELTSYILRCYYQEHLFGIKDFEPDNDHSHDIDIKQTIIEEIQKLLPEGWELGGMGI